MLDRRQLAIMGLIFIAGIGLIIMSYLPFWPMIHFAGIIDVIGYAARLGGYLIVAAVLAVVAVSVPCFPSDAKS